MAGLAIFQEHKRSHDSSSARNFLTKPVVAILVARVVGAEVHPAVTRIVVAVRDVAVGELV